mgnify:FL=1
MGAWSLQNGTLSVFVNSAKSVLVRVFDLVGNEIHAKSFTGSGENSVNLQRHSVQGRYVVNVQQGSRREVFTLSASGNISGMFLNENSSYAENQVLKKGT